MSNPTTLAPHSTEAEEAVLGSVLVNPNILEDLAPHLTPESFFILRNSWIFDAMLSMYQKQETIDFLTLGEKLRQRGQLEELGGSAYLTYLINNTPTYLHGPAYAQVVARSATRRKYLTFASQVAQKATSADLDVEEIEAEIAKDLEKVQSESGVVLNNRIAKNVVDEYDAQLDEGLTVFATGLDVLDNALGGGIPKGLTLIGGTSGTGKTWVLVYLIWKMVLLAHEFNQALRKPTAKARHENGNTPPDFDSAHISSEAPAPPQKKRAVYFVTYEMTAGRLFSRFIAHISGIPSGEINTRAKIDALQGPKRQRYSEALATLKDMINSGTLVFVEAQGLAADGVKTTIQHDARTSKREVFGIGIDHLHEVSGNESSQERIITEATRTFQHMSMRTFNCPVLLLAQQLEATDRKDKFSKANPNFPRPNDIQWSKQVKQACDLLLYIYDPNQHGAKLGAKMPESLFWICYKLREGTPDIADENKIAAISHLNKSTGEMQDYHKVRLQLQAKYAMP